MGGGVSTLPEDVLAEFNDLEEDEKALVQDKYTELIEGGTESETAMNNLIKEFSTANAQSPVFSDAIFLKIKQAKNLENTNFIGKIDPFVEISIPPSSGCIGREKGTPWKSSVDENSTEPEWNDKMAFLLNPTVESIDIVIKGNRRSTLGNVQLQIDRSAALKSKEAWYDFGYQSQILIEQIYVPLTLANTFAEKFVLLAAQLEETLNNQEASDGEKIVALTGQVEVLKGEKETAQHTFEETIANLRKEIEEKDKHVNEMQDSLEEFMKQVAVLEQENDALESEFANIKEAENNEPVSKAVEIAKEARRNLSEQGKKLGRFLRRR